MDGVEDIELGIRVAAAKAGSGGAAPPKSVKDLYAEENLDNIARNRFSTGELVDAVLVWQYPTDKKEREELIKEVQHGPRQGDNKSEAAKWFFRDYFEASLTNEELRKSLQESKEKLRRGGLSEDEKTALEDDIGLQERTVNSRTLIIEKELGQDGRTVYVKVHAPFETLCHVAEEIELVMPLKPTGKVLTTPTDGWAMRLLKKSFLNVEDRPDESTYCGTFRVKFLDKFENSDKPEEMFTPAQRTMLVYRILSQARYDRIQKDGGGMQRFGIDRMVQREIYAAAFPLHDSSSSKPPAPTLPRERYLLAETWARWGYFYKMQPLERIRCYFGEEVAFYFLWIGFYTQMLVPAAIVGFAVFLYGLGTYQNQSDAADVCNSNALMCGACSTCEKWQLNTACSAYKISWVFDNGGTVFFAFFMSLWATFFLELWKRETATRAFDWDVRSFNETEPPRPEFRPKDKRPDPVTQKLMPYFPSGIRARRYLVSALVILLMLSLVIWSVIAVIIFRLAVRQILYDRYTSLQNSAAAITSALAAILNLVTITILNMIYDKLAAHLTDWENHEKQTEHEQSLTLKVALFQFVNNYSSIFYIAFFKGQFVGRPGDRGTLFGYRQEECPQYGCLMELTIQLAIIMVGKQAINFFMEIILPWITEMIRLRASAKRLNRRGSKVDLMPEETAAAAAAPKKSVTRWERQFLLNPYPPMGMFAEYLEMVIQFGYTTLFVPAFPLAPFFALANNIFEVRLDARKLVKFFRRPFAERCEDIGVWFDILSVISMLAVITNAFVIAIPSSFIPKQVYYYSNGQSMAGYVSAILAPSPLNDASSDGNCYYMAFRDASGGYTSLYYRIMMARLAFIICFEHCVFVLKWLFAYVIPDVPRHVALAIQREEYAAKMALEEALYGPMDERAG